MLAVRFHGAPPARISGIRRIFRHRFRGDETGVAAVEAALVLPLFVGILLGIIDFGGLFYLKHEMNVVANEVSRSMALGYLNPTEAESRAGAMLPDWGTAKFTVTASMPSSDEVKLVISVPTEQAALVNFAAFSFGDTMSVASIKRKD